MRVFHVVYADWCGPCKVIAPTFESLSTKYSKPNKISFCKVNVDNQQEIASQYGVRAMPTFLILHNGSVIQTIQGANPPALSAAVEKAVKLAGVGGGSGASFGSQGRTLGGSGVGRPNAQQSLRRPLKWTLKPLLDAIVTFFGLYFVSLFTFDAYKSAESSVFNQHNPKRANPSSGAAPRPVAPQARFKTMSDI